MRITPHVGDTAEVTALLNGRKLEVAIVSQPDLESNVQAVIPQSARLHATARAWFACDGAAGVRLSVCNSLPVTIDLVRKGLAVALLPVRVTEEHRRRREVRIVPVTPAIAGHRVSLCYQPSEFGPQLERVLSLTRGDCGAAPLQLKLRQAARRQGLRYRI